MLHQDLTFYMCNSSLAPSSERSPNIAYYHICKSCSTVSNHFLHVLVFCPHFSSLNVFVIFTTLYAVVVKLTECVAEENASGR